MEGPVHISRVSRFRRFSALSPHGPREEAAHLSPRGVCESKDPIHGLRDSRRRDRFRGGGRPENDGS